jgi:hypothetical protein
MSNDPTQRMTSGGIIIGKLGVNVILAGEVKNYNVREEVTIAGE